MKWSRRLWSRSRPSAKLEKVVIGISPSLEWGRRSAFNFFGSQAVGIYTQPFSDCPVCGVTTHYYLCGPASPTRQNGRLDQRRKESRWLAECSSQLQGMAQQCSCCKPQRGNESEPRQADFGL